MPEQLTLDGAPKVPDGRPTAYWEHRGPRDWRPVDLVTRYGPGRGVAPQPFPYVRTGPAGPRNVAIRRDDGTVRVLPVRNLRRRPPC